jgi:hypothetical protein
MFNYDWFHGGGLDRQIEEAKNREYDLYREQLETRIILYLKDGLSYEMRDLVDIGTSSALTFECMPVDESYQVGAYVIVVPFEDIARVEVFAVHPDDKPQENIRIPGFKQSAAEGGRP